MFESDCGCFVETCAGGLFGKTSIWQGRMDSMAQQIACWECTECGQTWLHYSLEHETSAAWNRWFRAPLTREEAENLTCDSAMQLLRRSSWHFYGGSYYRTSGERSFGPIMVYSSEEWAKAA